MRAHASRWLAAALLVEATCFSAISYGQTAGEGKKPEDVKTRQERIEKGLPPVNLGKGQTKELDLAELMKLCKDPGLSIAVIDGYKIVWTKAYGVTELRGTEPVTTKTLFQAGSISKPVAATGMLALVQAGKLSLDGDVNAQLKTWKVPENEFTKEQKVTLRRLASHTAGLTVHGFPGYDVDEKIPTIVQILNGEKPGVNTDPIRVDFVPGTQERYSGGGITIEQLLMTDVTGKPFPVLMKEMVLAKIGMEDSSYEQPLPLAWQARTPTGTDHAGKSIHGKWHVYPEMAAAGLWTTPTDLANFAIEIALSRQGKSNKVLSQKTVEEMLTPVRDEAALGFFVSKDHPGEFGHDGADDGFQAQLVMNWETGQGAVLMVNSDTGFVVMGEVLRSIAKEYGWKSVRKRVPFIELMLTAMAGDADAVLARYDELKKQDDAAQRPAEFVLNAIGYDYLGAGRNEDAIRMFARNTQEFPQSANAYDSLGEAYAKAGQKDLAIENYEKSLQLDPKNSNAAEQLKKLKAQP